MMISEWHFIILFCAIILDMLVGDPDWLWRKYTHPIVWFGRATGYVDEMLNGSHLTNGQRKIKGVVALILLVSGAVVLGGLSVAIVSQLGFLGSLVEIVIVAIFIAQKSMSDHVERIIAPLKTGDIEGARLAVSMIVGRDTTQLDEASISRAAIESMSENFSDGVVAPIFWFAILGLPGLFAYKMINTADSMLGHMTEKYQDFGWASAKLDDFVNWVPARLSALFIILAAVFGRGPTAALSAIQVIFQDASLHRSPNAGWPEAAMAGGLGVALAGPRTYAEYKADDVYMNDAGRKNLVFSDIKQAKTVFWTSCLVEAFIILAVVALNQVL